MPDPWPDHSAHTPQPIRNIAHQNRTSAWLHSSEQSSPSNSLSLRTRKHALTCMRSQCHHDGRTAPSATKCESNSARLQNPPLLFQGIGAVYDLRRPVKTRGPVDDRSHAMFGWPMEEEAKLELTITVNWRREDGSIATTQLGTLDRGACRSAEDVGLQPADAKPIFGRLQEIVVSEQLERYCEALRPCPRCHRRRHLKDYRVSPFRYGVWEARCARPAF
jgi:hypothetical protein